MCKKITYSYNNYIEDPKSLSQGYLPKLTAVGMYWDTTDEDKNQFVDPWFAAKLQTSYLSYLGIFLPIQI